MADGVFNVAKGKVAYYAGLPETSDALIAVPLESSGLESDATLRDYDTLAAILGGTNTEQTTMGRETLANVSVTVDDANDRVDVDADDPVWTEADGNAVGKIVIVYDADTGTGDDSDLIPLTHHDFSATPDGSDITGTIATAGFYRAS